MDNEMFQHAYQARHAHELAVQAERQASEKRRTDASASAGRTAGRRAADGVAELPREAFEALSEASKRSFLERLRKGEARLLDPVR